MHLIRGDSKPTNMGSKIYKLFPSIFHVLKDVFTDLQLAAMGAYDELAHACQMICHHGYQAR